MTKTASFSSAPELIAPCGIDCRFCRAYARKKDPCRGCRDDTAPKPVTRMRCKIKTCEKLSAKTGTCTGCDEFPCARLSHLDKRYRTRYGLSVINNLISIGEIGMREFIHAENKKWTCPECGGMLIMHEPRCPSCGYAWYV